MVDEYLHNYSGYSSLRELEDRALRNTSPDRRKSADEAIEDLRRQREVIPVEDFWKRSYKGRF